MSKLVSTTKLNSDYISVGSSFGGDQTWFENIDRKWKGRAIKGFGCGLIGAADVLMYTLGQDVVLEGVSDDQPLDGSGLATKSKSGAVAKNISDIARNSSPNSINKELYMAYISRLEKLYFHILPKLGLSGILMALGVNLFFLTHRRLIRNITGCRFRAHWAVRPWKLLDKIREMLENDIPVVISIGPGFLRKDKVKLYSASEKNGKIHYKPVTQTKDHYVTVTGVVELSDITMIEISSWGKRYYINWKEYTDYVKKNDNYFFSNILYISKKPVGGR